LTGRRIYKLSIFNIPNAPLVAGDIFITWEGGTMASTTFRVASSRILVDNTELDITCKDLTITYEIDTTVIRPDDSPDITIHSPPRVTKLNWQNISSSVQVQEGDNKELVVEFPPDSYGGQELRVYIGKLRVNRPLPASWTKTLTSIEYEFQAESEEITREDKFRRLIKKAIKRAEEE
jgi:hypothetical protein